MAADASVSVVSEETWPLGCAVRAAGAAGLSDVDREVGWEVSLGEAVAEVVHGVQGGGVDVVVG
jgi:hypothetical protein